MTSARRTFLSAVWNHAGRILEYTLMYLTSIVIARGLGVEENGRFVGLFSVVQLLLVLCSFGLETSLNKFIPQLERDSSDAQARFILRKALVLRIAVFVVLAALFTGFLHVVSVPFLEDNTGALTIVVFFTGVRSVVPLFAMALTARLQTAMTAFINISIRIVELLAILWLMQGSFTVENLFLIFSATAVLHVVAYAAVARRALYGPVQPISMRPIITFGGLFWVNTLVDFVLGRQGDVLLLVNLHPDAAQASLYDVAYSIAQLAAMAMTVGLSGVMFATFARLAVEDQQKMDQLYGFSIRIISLLTVPLFCFVIVNAEAVLDVLYSSRYISAAPLVVGILIFRVVARMFGGQENAEYLLSRGRVGTIVGIGSVAAILNAGLNILLIPAMGAWGAVVAGGCGNLLANLLGALMVYRLSASRLQFWFWLKLSAISALAAGLPPALVSAQGFSSLLLNGLLTGMLLLVGLLVIKPLASHDAVWLSRISGRVEKPLGYFTSTRTHLADTRFSSL